MDDELRVALGEAVGLLSEAVESFNGEKLEDANLGGWVEHVKQFLERLETVHVFGEATEHADI